MSDGDSPATLDPCDSPSLLDVESNTQGTAILKRQGFTEFADLTIGTAPVTGSHNFIDANGNNQVIVCQDRNCAKSTNGNAFTTFLTTAAVGITRWSWVDVGGNAYAGNNRYDPLLKYDGTNLTYPTGMPKGSILELTQDRLSVSDITGNPNRVHYSSAGAYEQFTLGVNPEDSYFDDIGTSGDRVRGLKYFKGNMYIFKTASLTYCELEDQYSSACAVLSPSIGTTDPAGIVTTGDALYFRGQDKNYWEISGRGFNQISRKIPNLVKSQSGGLGGGENSNTQTSKADWDAGTQSPLLSWNTAVINGSIFPSSVTLGDNTTAQWALGSYNLNIDTSVAGSIRLTSVTVRDEWGNGLIAGRLKWTEVGGTGFYSVVANRLRAADVGVDINDVIFTSSVTFSSGSWKMTYNQTGTQSCSFSVVCWQMRAMTNAGGDYYALQLRDGTSSTDVNHRLSILKGIGGVETRLTEVFTPITLGADAVYEIQRTTDGRFFALVDGVFVASTPVQVEVSSSTKFELRAGAHNGGTSEFDNFYFYQYASSGTLHSRVFDTSYGSPIWGPFSSTFTVQQNIEGQVVFYTRTSADGVTFNTIAAASDTLRVTSSQQRYVKYELGVNTLISTKTPSVSAVAIVAATTGQFYTPCIQPNSSISAWGTLSCAETKAGNGSLVYYATSAVSCAALPTTDPSTWQTTVANNATVTVSTNIAIRYGFRSLLGASTDQAQVDACTLNWNEGSPTQPTWGVFDSIKNAIYWTATINSHPSSNRLLKYDRNLEAWYPWSIPAQAPRIVNNVLYFGGASSGTWNTFGTVYADLGNGFNSYWTSKDIGAENPFLEKNFTKISLLAANQGSGTLSVTSTLSNGKTNNYSLALSTTSALQYVRGNHFMPSSSPQNFMNLRLSNSNANEAFQVLGLGVDYTVQPWRVGETR